MKPATGLAGFVARILSNESRNRLTVRFASSLLLYKFGLVGFTGKVVGFFLRGVLGVFLEEGIFIIDILADAWREGEKLEQFKDLALAEYNKAIAKVYTEAEKNDIRKQYLKIIGLIGNVGNGPKP